MVSASGSETSVSSATPTSAIIYDAYTSIIKKKKKKYLGVAFTSDGRQDEEFDVRSGKASAVMRAWHHLVVLKQELSKKENSRCFTLIFVPILTFSHESGLWEMTEKVQSLMQAFEMRFLRKIKGFTMYDKVRKTAIPESRLIKLLLLRIKRPQLIWFGHVAGMPPVRFPKQTLYAEMNGKRPVELSRTR